MGRQNAKNRPRSSVKEQLGKQPRFNNTQRRRLAAKAKKIGLKHLKRIATLAPRILLDWHHRLVADKCASVGQRWLRPISSAWKHGPPWVWFSSTFSS
jgi:hypothetical protein